MNSSPIKPQSHLTPQEARKPQRNPTLSSSLRFSNLCGVLLSGLASMLLAPCPLLQAAQPPELTILRQQYERVLAEKATAPFDASLALLNSKFTTALDNAVVTAQQAGKLDDVLAIQDDKKRLTEKLPIPDDDEKTPAALKALRAIYREQLKKLEDTRTAAIAAVLPAYQAKLQDLETTLTKAARIDEAKELRAYRENLASGVTPAPTPTASVPSTPPTPSSPATSVAPKVKGDDRKAAEWLLKIGGEIEIEEKGKKLKPIKPEDLPKGKFTILFVKLGENVSKDALVANELSVLMGLDSLTYVELSQLDIKDQDLQFLATLQHLKKLVITRCPNLTDGIIEHLSGLKELEQLACGCGMEFTGAPLHKLGHMRSLESFSSGGTGFNAAGAEALSHIPSITSLGFEGSGKLTDEAIPHLSKLTKLTRLGVTNTNITPEGLAALKANLEYLDCGRISGIYPRDFAAKVAPAFSGLLMLRLPSSDNYIAADLEALAHFKSVKMLTVLTIKDSTAWSGLATLQNLESLTIDRNPFTDVEIDHLVKAPSLIGIGLMAVDVTDAGILKLAAMKKLKRLSLKPCPKVTEAGIAALKKQRPDIQITR